jgi:hypothetical protein
MSIHPEIPMTRAIYAILTVAVILATITGCGGTTVSAKDREFHELMQRPDIEQAASRYEELATKVRSQLSTTFPDMTWSTSDPVGGAGCNGKFRDVNVDLPLDDAESRGLSVWLGSAGLTNDRWQQAIATITPLLHAYGFQPGFRVDGPKDYQIDFYDQYDADFSFGSMLGTSLQISTGCHLTAEAKRRGAPAIPPSY